MPRYSEGGRASGPAEVRASVLRLEGSPVGGENPLPSYRSAEPDVAVVPTSGFPADKTAGFGKGAGRRVLPYRVQDRYDRELVDLELPTVVLENAFLRAEFVPSLGGRLWSLFDKAAGRDVLYRNPVLRPANLALRDAWFSGGIEWNVGRYGHAVHTCSPVSSGAFEDADGPVFRIWDFERQSRLYWNVDFRLSADAPVLLAYVRIANPDPEAKPLYWWTNAAVPETDRTRVLAPGSEAIFIEPGDGPVKRMGGGILPDLRPLPGKDISYPALSDYSNEYFVQCERSERDGTAYPWEAAVGGDGYGFAEASTAPLSFRKMFCWGNGRGGRRWQDYLSLPGERYLEVQAGLAPTQLHTASIGAGATVDWVQAFGAVALDPARAHAADYGAACAHAEDAVAALAGPAFLRAALSSARAGAGTPCARAFSEGSGWGAIEALRAERAARAEGRTSSGRGAPEGLSFSGRSIDLQESPWLDLLRTGRLPRRSVLEGPPAFAVGADWEALLAAAADAAPDDWLAPYLAAVSAYERGDEAAAEAWRRRSLEARPNAWALRDQAVALRRAGRADEALDAYRAAFERPEGAAEVAVAEEYVAMLAETGRTEEAARVLAELPASFKRGSLREAAALVALESGDDAELDRLLSEEPVRIREGSVALTAAWEEREARRLAAREALPADAARARVREAEARGEISPPRAVDFRMFAGR